MHSVVSNLETALAVRRGVEVDGWRRRGGARLGAGEAVQLGRRVGAGRRRRGGRVPAPGRGPCLLVQQRVEEVRQHTLVARRARTHADLCAVQL